MSAPKRSRKRAVRLTPEALAVLNAALAARWHADERAGKLTRETRAELMGMGVTTASKVLSGAGADRASLASAFKNLGLPWSDDLCERLPDEADSSPNVEDAETPSTPEAAAEPAPAFHPKGRRRPLAAAFLALAAAVGWGLANGRRPVPAPDFPWTVVYDRDIYEATARYHRADYPGAARLLEAALALARHHDSARNLYGALHLAGQLAEEQGDLPKARDRYLAALEDREQLRDAGSRPALYESLGVVETRLGEAAAARRHLDLCLQGYRATHDPVGVAIASRDLGTLAFRTGDLNGAEARFAKALASLKSLDKPDIVADVHGRQALVKLKQGRAAEARKALTACLGYWKAKGQPRWIAECEMHLALADEALHDTARATERLTRSKAAFERLGDRAGASEAAERLRVAVARR